jgi:hypothetical protein
MVYEENAIEPIYRVGSQDEFYEDWFEVKRIINAGPTRVLLASWINKL